MIEDDARLAHMVQEYLGQSGFEVTHAPDGEQGLSQLPLVQPDLVILDLMMPGIDGLEVCRRIRALSNEQARVPVLEGDTPERLATRVLAEEHRLYPQALRKALSPAN